jgi:hypothetical protein
MRSNARSNMLRWASRQLLLAVPLFGLSVAHVVAAPSARIVASRVSGPAPLAVHFDATGTTDSNSGVDPFRQLGYRFDFGDSAAGTWQYSGLPKNEQIGGPLAGHVFERPGTYIVRVTAKDASGASSDASVTVTVESPDSVYSGTNTVCISRTTDLTGCPAGAQQVANAGSWSGFQSNKRYLLRAGQDFTSLGDVSLGQFLVSGVVNFQLGSFGSGSKPRIGSVSLNGSKNPTRSNPGRPDRVTVMNMDTPRLQTEYGSSDVLFFKNSLTRGGTIMIGSVFTYELGISSSDGWQVPYNTFLVENSIGATDAAETGILGMSTRFVIMGNFVDRTNQHNIRIGQAHKLVVAHNRLVGHSSDQIRHGLKLHAQGIAPNTIDLTAPQSFRQRSSEIVLANNAFGATDNVQNWLATMAPQNNQSQEGVERVIAEDNRFTRGPAHSLDLYFVGRNVTERGNFNVTTNSTTTFVESGGESAMPSDWTGPYYFGQASMRSRFSGSTTVPMSPTLRVE